MSWAPEINPYSMSFWTTCFLPRLRPRSCPKLGTPCFEWMGKRTERGHGMIVGVGPIIGTHRYVLEMVTGFRVGDVVVMHECDNAPCCNPFHLRIGTHKDNMKDRVNRGSLSRSLERAWLPFSKAR